MPLPANAIDPVFPNVYPYLFSTDYVYGRDRVGSDLIVYQGNTRSIPCAAILDGVAVNLTGGSLRMTVKRAYEDLDAAKVFALTIGDGITVTNAAGGLFTITISSARTSGLPNIYREYVYDVQLTDASSNVYTLLTGRFILRPRVSLTSP